jgi:hypothetical protein
MFQKITKTIVTLCFHFLQLSSIHFFVSRMNVEESFMDKLQRQYENKK